MIRRNNNIVRRLNDANGRLQRQCCCPVQPCVADCLEGEAKCLDWLPSWETDYPLKPESCEGLPVGSVYYGPIRVRPYCLRTLMYCNVYKSEDGLLYRGDQSLIDNKTPDYVFRHANPRLLDWQSCGLPDPSSGKKYISYVPYEPVRSDCYDLNPVMSFNATHQLFDCDTDPWSDILQWATDHVPVEEKLYKFFVTCDFWKWSLPQDRNYVLEDSEGNCYWTNQAADSWLDLGLAKVKYIACIVESLVYNKNGNSRARCYHPEFTGDICDYIVEVDR